MYRITAFLGFCWCFHWFLWPQPDVTLSADISTLSSLVMGAFSLDEALRLGRLTFSDHGYAADVQRAIGWSRKPVNFTYF